MQFDPPPKRKPRSTDEPLIEDVPVVVAFFKTVLPAVFVLSMFGLVYYVYVTQMQQYHLSDGADYFPQEQTYSASPDDKSILFTPGDHSSTAKLKHYDRDVYRNRPSLVAPPDDLLQKAQAEQQRGERLPL